MTTVYLLDSKEFCFPGQRTLKAAFRQYITITNAQPKPSSWTKTADDILASSRCWCDWPYVGRNGSVGLGYAWPFDLQQVAKTLEDQVRRFS